METFKIIILVLSSLALFYASSSRLIYPLKANALKTYLTHPENDLEKDIDLVNEIRGSGAVMLISGIMILIGVFLPGFRQMAFVIAATIFTGIVAGRLISFGLDGKPNVDVIRASVIEFMLSALSVFCLINILLNSGKSDI